jgi:hypothetical protein
VFEALKMDVYRVSQKEREEAADLFATPFWESKDAYKRPSTAQENTEDWAKGDFLSFNCNCIRDNLVHIYMFAIVMLETKGRRRSIYQYNLWLLHILIGLNDFGMIPV